MLSFQRLPIHRPPEPVSCIALHDSLEKIAVGRTNGIIEVWSRKPEMSKNAKPYFLSRMNAGVRRVTLRGLFWEQETESQGEMLVAATLCGQFILYAASDLTIQAVFDGASDGFFAVARKSLSLKQTLPNGHEFQHVCAAATGAGFLKVFTAYPKYEHVATGSKNVSAMAALSVCFSNDANSIFLGDDAGCVQRFDTHKLVGDLSGGHTPHVAACVYNLSVDSKKKGLVPVALAMSCNSQLPFLVLGTSTGDIFIVCLKSDTILTSFKASKSAILAIQFVTDDRVLAGGITRDLVTVNYQKDGWHMGSSTRRVHCNDINCVASSNCLRTEAAGSTGASSPFLCMTGGADGEIFCSTSLQEFKGMFTKSILDMKRNVLKYSPFRFRSEAYGFSSVDDSQVLLTALAKNAVCMFALPERGSKVTPFLRLAMPKRGNCLRFVATTSDSKFLMYASSTGLAVLNITWASGLPEAVRPVSIADEAKLTGIQGIAFGWSADKEWIPFVACANEVLTISLSSGCVSSRFRVSSPIVKILAQQALLVVLCANDTYLIWDEEKGAVLFATVSMVHESSEAAESNPINELLLRKEQPTFSTSSDRITDVCFMHGNALGDFNVRPLALVLVNINGQFSVVSLEESSLGENIYASKAKCPSVYPLPGDHGYTPYSVTSIPREHSQGSILKDNCVCVFSENQIALFDLTSDYKKGAVSTSQKSFTASCRSLLSASKSTLRQLPVFASHRVLLVAPLVADGEGGQQKKKKSSPRKMKIFAMTLSNKEFLQGMRVYDAKRYAT
ncbi:mitochondrial serine hydroxymethyltransferase [Perkinsela sp. CCAP 1560/4]|nr:mitochondrial serine hydroxymethyltransferase [Perkinsela sp. CCAP 1560/4]|eukprot:KNH06402.1 mitochondrial serine hydroxymethyltransferase [Perkinsela sp. CCAP 1560/4]